MNIHSASKSQLFFCSPQIFRRRAQLRGASILEYECENFHPQEVTMIGYVTLGTKDLKRAGSFYDALAKELGVGRMMENERFIAWGTPGGGAGLGITYPFDERPATVGNGVMVALQCSSKEQVDRLYALAMSLGATDEGKPGPRGPGFYAAYFRDLDGNKLNGFCMG
jgi:predicted lactoylglutathione lyase